jgi:hypothetical protein
MKHIAICLSLILAIGVSAVAQDNNSSKTTTPTTTSAPQAKPANSDADIAAAKAAHKVWVNLDTGVYHKSGRWYGKTKNGKFMTEDDAKKAGYKAAKRD